MGDWLITSPNQDVIWHPPWDKRSVRLCADARYGFDDPTLWPQAYVIEYTHLGAIRRKPDDPNDPLSIMWWDPTESDFTHCPNGLVHGLGQLSKNMLEKFDACREELVKRIDEYKVKTSSPNYYLLALSKAMNHAGIRLGCIPSSFREMNFGVTEFQRYYLEMLGILDYLEVYKPRIDGAAARASTASADNRIGIFTSNARVAQEFYDAGLPVWFIRETTKLIENPNIHPNVLKLVETRRPEQFLVITESTPPFPVIYRGHTNKPQKYASMHVFSRTWMVYQDPFSQELLQNVDDPPDPFYSHKRPARESTTIPMSELMKERLPSPNTSALGQPQRCKTFLFLLIHQAQQMLAAQRQLPAHTSVGCNKFAEPESPLLPSIVPAWADALKAIDQLPQWVKNDAPKKVYAMPQPALFVTPSSDQKKISYLMTWIKCRVAWIYHLDMQANMAVLAQTWRDFLGMNFNRAANDQMATGQRHELMKKLIGKSLDKPGLSYSSSSDNQVAVWRGQQLADNVMPPLRVIHEVLWELYELSFHYELLALDWRLSQDHNQQNINACFPGGLALIRELVTRDGLGAKDWRTRLRYIGAFVRVMHNWNISHYPTIFQKVESKPELIMEQQALELERAAATFYAQQFFDHFGCAPVVPHQLD